MFQNQLSFPPSGLYDFQSGIAAASYIKNTLFRFRIEYAFCAIFGDSQKKALGSTEGKTKH
jgi:hypothetical protein